MSYSVGQVSRFAKVTVRTLHHYDEIKLLCPSGRTPSGYRRYDDADLDRLQQILFYRELGFSLDDIAAILDDTEASPSEHLRRQRSLLLDRIDRLQEMVASVEHALEARKMGINLTPEEKFEVFGEDYVDYQDEAEQRWGDTDAWKESQRRASKYTKQDWIEIQAETDALNARLGEAVRSGVAADSEQGMQLAEDFREQIDRRFYPVSYAMHRNLACLYISDPRFTANYEKIAPGAAAWLNAAIVANADRGESVQG